MNLDLEGKKTIICGSTQGLGFTSAVELALLGANVTLMARNEEKLKEAVKKNTHTKEAKAPIYCCRFSNPAISNKCNR